MTSTTPTRPIKDQHQAWRGYFPGSGFAFAQTVKGWNYELDMEVLFGRKLPAPLPQLSVTKLSRGELPDTLAMAGSGIFVSSNLHAVLKQAVADSIQFVPAGIKRDAAARYQLANLLVAVPCVDRERSDFDPYDKPPHAIRVVRRLVLTPIAPDTPPMFHIEEMPGVILVRDDLRVALQASSSSAGEFLPVSELRRGL